MTNATEPDAIGLTAGEVAERMADGRVNAVPEDPMPSVGRIVASNVLTPVNLIVGVMLILVVIAHGIGPDMLFGGVIVSNSVIGIVQELRARAALNRLAILTTPHAVVRRDGVQVPVDVGDIVLDDVLVLDSDSQVVVDGEVVRSEGLELNESLLTGESDPVVKASGDEVLSGSFVSSGGGAYRATRVGGDSYAAGLVGEARQFSLVGSELRQGVNQILKVLMALIPPVAALLFYRLMRSGHQWQDALSGVVAASVAMVPDGLVLLTSLAFMAGVVTLARRGALLRELAAVELLARVDTLCLDKTGTITTGRMRLSGIEPIGSAAEDLVTRIVAAFAQTDPDPNSTQRAIADGCPQAPGWRRVASIPFSSTRKWSAAQLEGAGEQSSSAVYLGAPEMLLRDGDEKLVVRVQELADDGLRVLMMATAAELDGDDLPTDLKPGGFVLLEDEIRPDSAETLAYFRQQGVKLKVISGDHPRTVASVARRAGVAADDDDAIDSRDLDFDDPDRLADEVQSHVVFGRTSPRQKREMMRALQGRGHKVAMTGDGVNDVLALKDSDMGIAMGDGSSASRSVAELVLVDNRFASLPRVVAEGRRVVNSVERAANLFIYGTVYSVLISAAVAIAGTAYPFLPRHLTLVRSLAVGLPGLFLALAPDSRVARPGFVNRVIRFCIPAGAVAAGGTLVVWFTVRSRVELVEARSACTTVLLLVGLVILVRLTGSLPRWRWALVSAMLSLVIGAFVIPFARHFFDLVVPGMATWWLILLTTAACAVLIRFIPVASDSPLNQPPNPHAGTPSLGVGGQAT